ncbi:mechanosensitive ion channel [bacterium]|nr:mechanosensitive ion channel [candidate division CSSED10-310 bacterium]
MEQVVPKLKEWIALYGLKVIAAIAILLIGWIVAKGIRGIIRRIMRRVHLDETLVSFVSSMCYVGILAFVIIAALGQLGVQTASFVVVLGSAGLAVGLALQGSLANFAAGVLMIIFKPFKVGDFIEGGGVAGVVEEIGIFTTELKSLDNKKIIVPNGKITGDNIVNYTANEIRRVDIVAGVSYQDDLDKVKNVLADILAKDDRVLKDPAPTIGVLELADSSVNFVVRPWVNTADYWDVFFAIQENIKKRFDSEGICIPFPQQDVHLHKAD